MELIELVPAFTKYFSECIKRKKTTNVSRLITKQSCSVCIQTGQYNVLIVKYKSIYMYNLVMNIKFHTLSVPFLALSINVLLEFRKSIASRKHTYIILLYSKTGVYRGIHYLCYFCSKT